MSGTKTDDDGAAPSGDEPTLRPLSTPASLPSGSRAPIGVEQPGRYRLLRELARGGQGVVYVAWDEHLGREVAFKQLLHSGGPTGTLDSLTQVEARFVREARITAQLDHPGIAPVHEVGRRADGSLYVTQKLVRGRTLAAALEAAKSLPERMALLQPFLGVCQAVAFAHQRGVIHRDLKPGNVLLGDLGEVVVLDWGLGRTNEELGPPTDATPPVDSMLEGDAGRTQEGALLGTPAYMSPEQARGAQAEVDARSDVWSLGVMLYEILAGQRPFEGATTMAVLVAVSAAKPRPIPEWAAGAPADLCAAVQRALNPDRARRYDDAQGLARELSAWLSGGRVVAYEYGSWELARKFLARNRLVSILAALALVLLTAASLGLRARYLEARHSLAQAFLEKAHAAERDQRWLDAPVFYAAARVQEESLEARVGAAIDWGQAADVLRVEDHDDVVTQLAFSGDGTILVSGDSSGSVAVRDALTGAPLRWLENDRSFGANPLALSPDGRTVVRIRETHLETVDVKSGATLSSAVVKGRRWEFLEYSPDGRWLAAGNASERRLLVAEVGDGGVPGPLLDRGQGAIMSFSADGSRLVAGEVRAGRTQAWIYETSTWASPRVLVSVPGSYALFRPFFLPDGNLVSRGMDTIEIRDGTTGQVLKSFPVDLPGQEKQQWLNFAVSPDGKLVATTGAQASLNLWDLSTGRVTATIPTPQDLVSLRFSPDGRVLAAGLRTAGLRSGSFVLWRLPSAARPDISTSLLCLRGGVVASLEMEWVNRRPPSEVTLWRRGEERPIKTLGVDGGIGPIAASPDGLTLAVGPATGGAVELWPLVGGEPRRLPLGSPEELQDLAFSADGARLFVQSDRLRVLEVGSGRTVFESESRPQELSGLGPSPDGKLLLVGLGTAGAEIRDARSYQVLATTPQPVANFAWSADGQSVLVGRDGALELLDTSLRVLTHRDVPGVARALSVSPDGLVATAAGGTIQIRSARTLEPLTDTTFQGPMAQSVSFCEGGRTLVFDGPAGRPRWLDVRDPASLPEPVAQLEALLTARRARLEGVEIQRQNR